MIRVWFFGVDHERSKALVKRSRIGSGKAKSAEGRSRNAQEASLRPPRGLEEAFKRSSRGSNRFARYVQGVSKGIIGFFMKIYRVSYI